jgi:hypothetical protein
LIEQETSSKILELFPLDAYQERLNVEVGYNRIREKVFDKVFWMRVLKNHSNLFKASLPTNALFIKT